MKLSKTTRFIAPYIVVPVLCAVAGGALGAWESAKEIPAWQYTNIANNWPDSRAARQVIADAMTDGKIRQSASHNIFMAIMDDRGTYVTKSPDENLDYETARNAVADKLRSDGPQNGREKVGK
ncbi:hypothetical protein [Pandoraea apista]|uniref:hypothetical protein n=1 Tax=Pandoraea apista TaxID=93218 RepID=UPI000659E90D|nr:hypothetical protein [Pandoraea apista]ALS68378.1 hypothetical protein AT395_24845 [Pandoraea apista]ALS68440.1 hypothetical protein AT395_25195 [Pandoraea apista]CFB60467.1 hypothetical protein LMG16407_00506 [Pandoraea apista]